MESKDTLLTAIQTSTNTSEFESGEFGGGAQLLKDINTTDNPRSNRPSGSRIYNLTEFDGRLFFSANDGISGQELWVSDCTTEGTQLLKDINISDNQYFGYYRPSGFTEFGGQLFFVANDGISGQELWVSDGTTEGTQLLKDINISDNSHRSFLSGSFPSRFTEFDSQLFFVAYDGITGDELWVSDGTTEGTQLLKDINTTDNKPYDDATNIPFGFTEFDGQLFFSANDGIAGQELWVSDGTAEGTQLLKDINTTDNRYSNRSSGSRINNLTEFDGQLFFSANDGIAGQELWVSDGTAEGTQLLKDINTTDNPYGRDNSPLGSSLSSFTELNSQLFFVANDGITARELWVSDGTAEGTQLLKDINIDNSNPNGRGNNPYDSSGASIYSFTEFDGQLFFVANDGIVGLELWGSDGTTEGTTLLKDINPDNDNYFIRPSDLTVAGDLLFFTTDDGITGRELWVSDGTTEGTQLFQDINPGTNGSKLGNLRVVGDQLFFSADDGTTGRELWVVSIPDNLISGDENNNILNGSSGIDLMSGLGGNDIVRGQEGNDILNGGSGNDVLFGDEGDDTIRGGADNDQIFGDQGDDDLQGGSGNDQLEGGAGNDIIAGEDGNDIVIVTHFTGVDSFDGGNGDDLIRFDPVDGRNLTIFLGRGKVGDRNIGGQSFTNFEQITAGRGNDRLLGDNQANQLDGGNGNDLLRGAAGQDTLVGGEGRDTLIGGQDADVLNGGRGDDVLIGDEGIDTFQFDRTLLDEVSDTDTIQNFEAEDVLDFADYIGAGGSVDAIRVTSGFLRIELSKEDAIHVFGQSNALDIAESNL